MVRDQRQQERITGLFFESAQGWRDSLLVTTMDTSRPRNEARRKLADSASALLNRFLERLGDPLTRESMAGFAAERLREDHRTLGAFVSDVFRIRDSEIAEILSARVLDYLDPAGDGSVNRSEFPRPSVRFCERQRAGDNP